MSWLVDNVTHYSVKVHESRHFNMLSVKIDADLLLRQAPGKPVSSVNLQQVKVPNRSSNSCGLSSLQHAVIRLLSGCCLLYTVLVGVHMYCKRREAVSVILYYNIIVFLGIYA